jgi:hypothetical protein
VSRHAPGLRAPNLRVRLRRLGFGLSTVLGIARRGFFIPYRYAGAVPPADGVGAYDALDPIFAARRDGFAGHLAAIEGFAPALAAIGGAAPNRTIAGPRWNQSWFSPLDAAAAYAMVRLRRPSAIVEIGSGHSTRFLARAIRDAEIATRLVAIDPAPRARLPDGVEWMRATLHAAALDIPAMLAPGDMLFVDSSHVLMPGTDVDAVLNRIWPRLASGVIVHFHDIFLPDGYPRGWAWRGYNEQLGVGALIAGGGADILFASRYVATRMADAAAAGIVARLPRAADALASSLWLMKRG